MKFYIYNSSEFLEAEKSNIFSLHPSKWDDWFKYETSFMLYYYNSVGNVELIGSLKIGEKNMSSNQRKPNIPNTFEKLNDNFFSLGQDVSYYEKLNKFEEVIRNHALDCLNDIALKDNIYQESLKEEVTRISLLRSVSQTSVEGQFRRLALGNSKLTQYTFSFHAPKNPKSQESEMILTFDVIPDSNPPTNINVIIGRNGVGKTHIFSNMISSLILDNKDDVKNGFFENLQGGDKSLFANLVSVSFSAFDETNPMTEKRDKTKSMSYSYIGIKRDSDNIKAFEIHSKKIKSKFTLPPKSPQILKNEFIKSVEKCKIQGKRERWLNTLLMLEADPIFKESEISQIIDIGEENEFKRKASLIFNKLSSGHKVVLLTITRLVEVIEERSLVLLDEPEGYLHPPLLSAFIRALSEVLINRNAVAIIATHSPVVLQEVPSSCVWKLRRHGATAIAERLEIESFGENVGILTQEVFGLEVTESGFHNIIRRIAAESQNFDSAIRRLDYQLGQEGRAILRTLINLK